MKNYFGLYIVIGVIFTLYATWPTANAVFESLVRQHSRRERRAA